MRVIGLYLSEAALFPAAAASVWRQAGTAASATRLELYWLGWARCGRRPSRAIPAAAAQQPALKPRRPRGRWTPSVHLPFSCPLSSAHDLRSRPGALRLGRGGPAQPGLPRCRMGRADHRRPGALRAALPGGRPGGAGLDHHPAQARRLPPRLRRLRPEATRRLGRARGRSVCSADPGIVRNRAKVRSVLANARALPGPDRWLRLLRRSLLVVRRRAARSRTDGRRWARFRPRPMPPAPSRATCGSGASASSDPPSCTPSCSRLGLVNDHLVGCFRHAEVAALGRSVQMT